MEGKMVFLWLALLIVFIVAELISAGLTSIWFAGGAGIAAIIAAFKLPIWLQIVVFVIISVVLLVFTRPIAKKYFNKNRTKTNVDSMIGQEGIVMETIDNLKAQGKISVNGMEWTARTESKDLIIREGSTVIVTKIDGVKAIVELKES